MPPESQSTTYRANPVNVEAIQWTYGMARRPILDFTNELAKMNDIDNEFYVYNRLQNTWIPFTYGDFIVRGPLGEFYPVSPSVFAIFYSEEVDDYKDCYPGDGQWEDGFEGGGVDVSTGEITFQKSAK